MHPQQGTGVRLHLQGGTASQPNGALPGAPLLRSLRLPGARQTATHRLLCGFQPAAGTHPRRCSPSVSTAASTEPQVGTPTFGPQSEALLTTDSVDDFGVFNAAAEAAYLQGVVDRLAQVATLDAQVQLLLQEPRAQMFFSDSNIGHTALIHIQQLPAEDAFVLCCLPVINQPEVLALEPPDGSWRQTLLELSQTLHKCNVFYDAIGGLIGYQLKICQLMAEGLDQQHSSPGSSAATDDLHQRFLVPPGLDLREDQEAATAAAVQGLQVLSEMAEIVPLGGAGDRLGLQCEKTGQSLPTAMLAYCSRTLLESIVRDIQAREYLYWRITGQQLTTPVAVMTSDAKGNHNRIEELLEQRSWFGRGPGAFRLFCQPLVPVVSVEDGKWLVPAAFKPMLKPGGHGVIWKLMQDNGVFEWLQGEGRKAALVRQISNPLAGTDTTLLALAGTGRTRGHAFGFASCERAVGAAEGMNVLVAEESSSGEQCYGITNVEYTEFERLGISDEASSDGASTSLYPANTNILYVGLDQAVRQLQQGFVKGGGAVLPGMIFNLNKKVAYTDALTGMEHNTRAGRMECTMQNLADCFRTPLDAAPQCTDDSSRLDTFLVYNLRKRTTSSAKRKRKPGSDHIHQTPDGSFYDLQGNARDLLVMCGMKVPELGSVAKYLEAGPGFIFLFHPGLGPLWSVIAQKIRGGALGARAEMVLEVAEVDLQGLVIDDGASFQVSAENVIGRIHQPGKLNGWMDAVEVLGDMPREMLVYDDRVGRLRMHNVRVANEGVDWSADDNCFWGHQVRRQQTCKIALQGNAEFEAHDCCLAGDLRFEVPDGHRLHVTAGSDGELVENLQRLPTGMPSWSWHCSIPEGSGRVALEIHETAAVESEARS